VCAGGSNQQDEMVDRITHVCENEEKIDSDDEVAGEISDNDSVEILDKVPTSKRKNATTLGVSDALQRKHTLHETEKVMDKFYFITSDFSCPTCHDRCCTDVKVVDVLEKGYYEQMASGHDW
jgi:hypothetical protein